ncbi:hypothetical protein OIU76_009855 [Salix suchowensis]|nr:hypothetical protein OIU76_009855 [Salix suchowensis]
MLFFELVKCLVWNGSEIKDVTKDWPCRGPWWKLCGMNSRFSLFKQKKQRHWHEKTQPGK